MFDSFLPGSKYGCTCRYFSKNFDRAQPTAYYRISVSSYISTASITEEIADKFYLGKQRHMSIKALAVELYRAQQKVHQLQDKLEKAEHAEKDALRFELKQAEADCNYLRRLVDAEKSPSPFNRDSFRTRR